ncbi:MAG: hypothetical protein ACO1SV_15155 [Fimbriimonas sp.]
MANIRKRSRLSAIALGAMATLCLCGVGGAGIGPNAVSGRAGGLPSAFERARGAGLAVTLTDLHRKVPPEEDALPAVERALATFRGLPQESLQELYELGNLVLSFEADASQKDRLRARIREASPALEALQQAAALPKLAVKEPEVRFDPRPQTPGEVIGLGVLLFSVEALLAGEEHDLAQAEKALERGRALLPHLEAEWTYPAYRRRAWAEIRLQRALVRIVQENAQRPEADALLQKFQGELGPVPSVKTALAGDLALALDAIARRKEEDVEQLPLADAFKDMGRADIVGIFTRAVERMPAAPGDLRGIEATLEKMEEEADDAPIYGGYAKGYRSILSSLKDVVTRRRLAKCATAILAEVRQGKIPDRLPDLGDDSIDPHNGKPFHYRREVERLVVYSVGRDTLDDKGLERPPRRLGVQTRDVVFALPIVPPKGVR